MKNVIFRPGWLVDLTSSQEYLSKLFYSQLKLPVVCRVEPEMGIIVVFDQSYQSISGKIKKILRKT